jgi:hypothetical protein
VFTEEGVTAVPMAVELEGTRGGRRMVASGELLEGDASLAGLGRGDRVTLGHKCIVRSMSSGNSSLRVSLSDGDFPDIKIR